MSIAKNWWELTACGARYCEDVIDALSSGRSVALVGEKLPWRETFYEKLKGANISASKAFETVIGGGIKNPAEYLFDRYCPKEIRSNYWPEPPEYTHVNFLAENDGILLNHRFIIVQGLAADQDFVRWCEFVEKYSKCVAAAGHEPEERATFILEYAGAKSAESQFSAVCILPFAPREVDVFTYNLVNTAEMSGSYLLNKYAAELAGGLCGGSIEESGRLSEYDDLLRCPPVVYADYQRANPEVPRRGTEQITHAILSAQFKVLFPVIEEHRKALIEKYYSRILCILPWQNDFKEIKVEPFDMELRDLLYKASQIGLSEEDKNKTSILRDDRNLLAHNHLMSYEEILTLLRLQ